MYKPFVFMEHESFRFYKSPPFLCDHSRIAHFFNVQFNISTHGLWYIIFTYLRQCNDACHYFLA
jgi:hypothetical protein